MDLISALPVDGRLEILQRVPFEEAARADILSTAVDKCFTRSSRWSFGRSTGEHRFIPFTPEALET